MRRLFSFLETRMKLDVHIEKSSLLNNITHFFSKEDAYIQELLQNARRAEASRVDAKIDTKAGTLTVTDDGHGITDPQSLLTNGKSDWAEAIKEETPAGMGFYSVFKVGSRASIRSKRFLLEMDLGELKQGKQAMLTESLPKVNGTSVTVHSTWQKLLQDDKLTEHAKDAAIRRWKKQATYMPFSTKITVDDKTESVEACDPRKKPDKLILRSEHPWGHVDVAEDRHAAYDERFLLVSQGVAVNMEKHLPLDRHEIDYSLGMVIHCRPGTVNFTLPDRDNLINDGKLNEFIEDVKEALLASAINTAKHSTDKERRKHLASLVYALDLARAMELPEDLQTIQCTTANGYVSHLPKAEIAKQIKNGALVFTCDVDERQLLQFLAQDILMPSNRHEPLLKKMFPDIKLVKDYHIHVSKDPRGQTLWHADTVKLRFDNGEKRELPPVKEASVLARPEFDESLKACDFDKAQKCEHDFVVIHSCEDEVGLPDLESWHDYYDEDMSYEEADNLWRTGQQNTDIIATWQGIPRHGLTLCEFSTLLHDKLKVKRGSYLIFTDMDLEPWDNEMTIGKATVLIKYDGDPTRVVKLLPEENRLRVGSETTIPGDPVEEDEEEVEVEENPVGEEIPAEVTK